MSKILRGCLKIVTGVILMGGGLCWGSGLFFDATLGKKIFHELSGLAEFVVIPLIILSGAFCAYWGLSLIVSGFREPFESKKR